MSSAVLLSLLALAPAAYAQVTATGTMGTTNPPAPTYGVYNQTSMSRLLSVNSVDDFCIFSPPVAGDTIGDTEEEQVAWCTKPRNDARVIPDGTITGAHFVKTPLYVQITGFGNLTKLNIQQGDEGGELDPHGSTGLGNPVGGNVTSNITGTDVNYEEWMNYVAYDSFCIRICTAENSTYSASVMCQHTFDLMGCEWVMPGDYTEGTFTTCDGDSSYPPGVYPVGEAGSGNTSVSTSTFAQRYTGTYTDSATTDVWTIGYTVTPQTPYMTPASSNCQTLSTIANGLTDIAGAAVATASSGSSGSSAAAASMTAASGASGSSAKSAGAAASTGKSATGASATATATSAAKSASSSSASSSAFRSSEFPVMGSLLTLGAVALGAGAILL